LRRDLPLELCDAIDVAVWPEADERGTIAELRAALRDGLDVASEETGTVVGAPIEPFAGAPDTAFAPAAPAQRVAGALAAALLAASPALLLGAHTAGIPAPIAAAVAFVCVGLLPRLGWMIATGVVLIGLAGPGSRPDLALIGLLATAPVPLLLRRAESWSWSVPGYGAALAVVAGVVAAPAVAIRIASPVHRASAGLLCAWWAALAQVASGHGIVSGLSWDKQTGPGMNDNTIAALVSSPMLMFAALCAAGAVVAPWLVRGRSLRIAALGALLWAGALTAAWHAVVPAQPLRLIASGAIAAALVVLLRPSPRAAEPVSLA
jgi:hypothetical protein